MATKLAVLLIVYLAIRIVATTDCATVWLTVSSLLRFVNNNDKVTDAELEVNWRFDCPSSDNLPDTIKVFSEDPVDYNLNNKTLVPKLTLSPIRQNRGYYRTNIIVGRPPLPPGWNKEEKNTESGPRCMNHYVALYKNNEIVMRTCLKIWPTWMHDTGDIIGKLPIASLMIPGTHNSGSYFHPDLNHYDPFRLRFLITQDRDVATQLRHGIRYLDLRVAYYPPPSNDATLEKDAVVDSGFWINHDIIRIRPLAEVIKDVRDFIHATAREIVILDFHRFPVGINNRVNRHRHLVSMLQREFNGLLVKHERGIHGNGPTLEEIWAQNKRIIICYGDKRTANDYEWLWPPLFQAWGDKQKTEELLDYLEEVVDADKSRELVENPMWALMAELTPRIFDIIFKTPADLRTLADSVNRNLTEIFKYKLWNGTNIIATDYFLGNNLIEVAIDVNLRKAEQLHNNSRNDSTKTV